MPWILKDIEMKKIIELEPIKRYEYFIKKVVDNEIIWLLKNQDGFVLSEDDNNCKMVPIWPHEKYAFLSATGEWNNCEPEGIELDDFMENWLIGMKKDNLLISVFPVNTNSGKFQGVQVDADKLKEHLDIELEKY